MTRVRLEISREFLEHMLALDGRRIVGVSFVKTDLDIEPTALVALEVDAPDAPDGATAMVPTYRFYEDGEPPEMLDPGWVTW